MTSNNENIEGVSAIRQRLAARLPEQEVPGTLTQWADAKQNRYWEFVGNGQTTSAEFVQAVVDREAQGGSGGPQAGQPPAAAAEQAAAAAGLGAVRELPFARYAAGQLMDGDPDAAIPKGEVRELALKDLVRLISPFIDAYREQIKNEGGGGGGGGQGSAGELKKVVGHVPSHGLTLPVD